jgi:hypothetical protein
MKIHGRQSLKLMKDLLFFKKEYQEKNYPFEVFSKASLPATQQLTLQKPKLHLPRFNHIIVL